MKRSIQRTIMLSCLSVVITQAGLAAAQCVAVAHRDPVLGRRFVTVRNSAHPEWPARTVAQENLSPGTTLEASPVLAVKAAEVPLIRAGQQVQLWKHESGLQMEVSGIAEDNGSMGQKIRVRLALMSEKDQPPQEIAGIVRGAQSVEMVQ